MLYKYRRAVRKRGDFKSGTKDKFDIDKIRKAVYNVDVPKRRHNFFKLFFKKPLTRLEVFLIMYICVSM